MIDTYNPFDLDYGSLGADEIGPSYVLYELHRACIPSEEELKNLSNRDIETIIEEVREPYLSLIKISKELGICTSSSRKLKQAINHSKSRVSKRLTPEDEWKIRKPKHRKKGLQFLKRVSKIKSQLQKMYQKIPRAKKLLNVLSYIDEVCEHRDDLLTDIHLQAGLRLEEQMCTEFTFDGQSIRAKADQYLARRTLLGSEGDRELPAKEITEHLRTWTEKILGKSMDEIREDTSRRPCEILSNYQLRSTYQEVVEGFSNPRVNWVYALQAEMSDAQKSGNSLKLMDLVIVVHCMLENAQSTMRRELYGYYYKKLITITEKDFLQLTGHQWEEIQEFFTEFLEDYQMGEFEESEHFESPFAISMQIGPEDDEESAWENPGIEGIDFQEIIDEGNDPENE